MRTAGAPPFSSTRMSAPSRDRLLANPRGRTRVELCEDNRPVVEPGAPPTVGVADNDGCAIRKIHALRVCHRQKMRAVCHRETRTGNGRNHSIDALPGRGLLVVAHPQARVDAAVGLADLDRDCECRSVRRQGHSVSHTGTFRQLDVVQERLSWRRSSTRSAWSLIDGRAEREGEHAAERPSQPPRRHATSPVTNRPSGQGRLGGPAAVEDFVDLELRVGDRVEASFGILREASGQEPSARPASRPAAPSSPARASGLRRSRLTSSRRQTRAAPSASRRARSRTPRCPSACRPAARAPAPGSCRRRVPRIDAGPVSRRRDRRRLRHVRRRQSPARRPSPGRNRAPSPTPSGVSLMFAGLRSRWTMPLLVRRVERVGDLSRDRRAPRASGIGPRAIAIRERRALDQLEHERADAVAISSRP